MSFNVSYIFEAIDSFTPTVQRIKSRFQSLTNSIKSHAEKLNRIGRGLTKFGKSLTMRVGAPLVALGALSLHTANSFDKSMNMVQAVTSATGSQFESLKKKAMLMGMTTQFTARDAANAMKFLGLSGFKTNNILKAMPGTLQLAASAQLDMGSSANIVTNILHGYGAKVTDLSRINDVLTAAFTNTNTNLVQLGGALKMVGPIAHKMRVPFEETTAALGMLGQAGIQGTLAGTSLRRALINMAKPSGDAARFVKAMGLKFVRANGTLLSMTTVIKELQKAQLTAAGFATVFGIRAGPAMAALVGQGAPAIQKLINQLKNSSGIAARIAKTQMHGLPGAMYRLKAASEHVQIAVVDANNSLAIGLTHALTTSLLGVSRLSPSMRRLVGEFVSLLIVIGPLAMGLGKVLIMLRLMGMVKTVDIILRLAGVFGVLGLAVVGIALGFQYLYNKFKLFRDQVDRTNKFLVGMFTHPFETAYKVLLKMFNLFKKLRSWVTGKPLVTVPHIGAMSAAAPRHGGMLGSLIPARGLSPAAGAQHKVASTLNIKVDDPSRIVKHISGESDADAFNMDIGSNMLLSRY